MWAIFFLSDLLARKNNSNFIQKRKRIQENATEFDDWRHAKEDQILFSTSTFYYYR